MTAVKKRFAGFAEPGESMLEYDVCQAPRGKVGLVASDRAVYVLDLDGAAGHSGIRIRYEDLTSFRAGGGLITIATVEGGELTVTVVGKSRGVDEVLRAQVRRVHKRVD